MKRPKKCLKSGKLVNIQQKCVVFVKSISETKTQGIVFVYFKICLTGEVMLGMLLEMEGFTNTKWKFL